jgi:hypothetical protein
MRGVMCLRLLTFPLPLRERVARELASATGEGAARKKSHRDPSPGSGLRPSPPSPSRGEGNRVRG